MVEQVAVAVARSAPRLQDHPKPSRGSSRRQVGRSNSKMITPPAQASEAISGSMEAVLDPSATNLPPNQKLFKCRVSWRPEMGKKGSLISAYIPSSNSRFKFSVPCERDFMMRLTLPVPADFSDERIELTQLARIHQLRLSSRSSTGYYGVCLSNSRFTANYQGHQYLGTFDTAAEAAIAVAKAATGEAPVQPHGKMPDAVYQMPGVPMDVSEAVAAMVQGCIDDDQAAWCTSDGGGGEGGGGLHASSLVKELYRLSRRLS